MPLATGGVGPYTWSVSRREYFPAGLTLDPSGDITGTPTSTGTSAFTIEATDSASPTPSAALLPCTLVVGPPQPLQVTPTSVTAGTEGVYYSSSLQSTGRHRFRHVVRDLWHPSCRADAPIDWVLCLSVRNTDAIRHLHFHGAGHRFGQSDPRRGVDPAHAHHCRPRSVADHGDEPALSHARGIPR